MNSNLFLFLPARNENVSEFDSVTLSWVYENTDADLILARGLLSSFSEIASQFKVTIVLPGEDVLFLDAKVPGKNSQRVQQAIPYVLEDNVIDDVDDLHFSINKKQIVNGEQTDLYDVSIINKKYFELIIRQLESVDIYADVMTVDYLLLQENNSLFFDGKRVLFNSKDSKFSCSIDSSLTINDKCLTETKSINLMACDKDARLEKIVGDISCYETLYAEEPLIYLVKNRTDSSVNLLQGLYKKKKDWSQTGRTWLPVMILFFVWVFIKTGFFIVEYINLSSESEILKTEITKIYKNTFPDSRRIIDAKAQMQQKLTSLQKRKGQSGRGFTEMLSASATVFSKTKGLNIKSLRYYDGRINIELQVANLQVIDSLKEQLTVDKGYKVEIQNVSSDKENVTAKLQITGAEL